MNCTQHRLSKQTRLRSDWSELPSELLQLICQKLNNNEFYLLRFRSVCSSWRRSSSFQNCHHNHLPSKLPHLPKQKDFFLMKQNIFLIKPPSTITQHQTLRPWLIRIGPDEYGKNRIWHPFDARLKCAFYWVPLHFVNRLIDFNQLSVLHLGNMFHIYTTYLLRPKVVVQTCEVGQPIAILTYDEFRVPIILQCEDDSWKSIPTMPRSLWGNICLFKGQPCVADKNGRTLMIGENLSILLLANPVVGGGNVKFLLESECDLLLVDCYGIDTSAHNYDKDIRFDVFRLDEKEKKWVKLTTLGDRVLFVDEKCSFSASASDLHVANGNCIIFCRSFIEHLDNIQSRMLIFHLDQGQVSLLSDYPDYIKLFWPPPKWILDLHNSMNNDDGDYDDDDDSNDDD